MVGDYVTEDDYVQISSEEPQTYNEAIQSEESEEWQKAMSEEHESLLENDTWMLVEPPND